MLFSVTVTGTNSVKITDLASLRGRAGWEVGQFLPYGFGGLAIGRANVTQTASASASCTDTTCLLVLGVLNCTQTNGNLSFLRATNSQTGEFVFGGAAGLGPRHALMSNMFLRLEWEYLLFAPIQGIHADVNSLRGGLGVLF